MGILFGGGFPGGNCPGESSRWDVPTYVDTYFN